MTKADAGGAAPQPTPRAGGPIPADLADLLPEGFTLPSDVQLVYVPPVTPEAHAAGLREHADRQAELLEGAKARLEEIREDAAAQIAAAEAGVEMVAGELSDAEAAAGEAEAAAAEPGTRTEGGD